MPMVRLITRLMAIPCFLLAPVLYLLVAHQARVECDRTADKCVLEETRPLRNPQVQTIALADVLDAGCQLSSWIESPQSATVLKQGRRPFNPGEAGVWQILGDNNDPNPTFRLVLYTRGGIVRVQHHFVKECPNRDAVTQVLNGHAAHGELQVGQWSDAWLVSSVPAVFGLALLMWAPYIGKPRAA